MTDLDAKQPGPELEMSPEEAVQITAPVARTSTLFNPRMKIGIVFALVAAGLVYFAWTAFDSATVTFRRVADVAAAGPTPDDRMVGLIGKLVNESYVRSADGTTASFRLIDEGGSDELRVSYRGEIGQVFFNEHSEIILEGRMNDDNVFVADRLQVRCPTKYLTESERAELEAQNNGEPVAPPYQPDYFDNKT
jgi:cytochrome c-type biogenesis protein CcmE